MNFCTSLGQKLISPTFLPIRFCSSSKGIKYKGFTYYPRHDDFQDPPYEPSKLFLIKRIKSLRGTTFKQKRTLALLNIDGEVKDNGHINVVKNIPSTNALLWKVKHLVEIKPITWKGELPEDGCGTYLRDTGELIIAPKLKVTSEQLEVTEEILKKNVKFSGEYHKKYLKDKWLKGYVD